MEYLALNQIPYYEDCNKIVEGLGYSLVSVKVTPMKGRTQVQAVIAFKDPSISEGIGIDDCAKVHRLLAPTMENLLSNQDVYMEVTSPGMERAIKNAAEFALFVKKNVKVYSVEKSDWIEGEIVCSDENQLTLKTASSNENLVIPYTTIAKAKLIYL
ncbi:MAG: ribosome maturation factor [Treponemataceae bacterium]|nr:ribosome maturation factor [Treponemataceae bacterium]